ncbi:hypothetical protein [Hydrogenophaga sp.]|uniref:hypothetical protein n=1 Tax=Hydrogenophaga sp. TaxID=1904254 RepID=UPI002627ADD8|nr:hypothetical protein [Hydrogenophaga sp.]MCW5655327.1 hypothetical protein [Hydrogenophaga sp.]
MQAPTSPRRHSRAWLATAALTLALPAWASSGAPKAAADATYQRERAACTAMAPGEARTNCLRDLGAARQQSQRGGRAIAPTPEQLEHNALQRCQPHPPDERALCERMVRGEGSVSGSVSGGGLIRELVTQEPVITR